MGLLIGLLEPADICPVTDGGLEVTGAIGLGADLMGGTDGGLPGVGGIGEATV